MAVTSYNATGTCANNSGTDWANDDGSALSTNRVSSDNNLYAMLLDSGYSGRTSGALKCTGFGFTSSDVPSGATINGFEIEVRQFRQSGILSVSQTTVKLVKGGTISGSDFGTSTDWATTETVVTYGSSSQLGGLSFTQSDVVASNFGVSIALRGPGTSATDTPSAFIDQIRVRCYYTAAASTRRRVSHWHML